MKCPHCGYHYSRPTSNRYVPRQNGQRLKNVVHHYYTCRKCQTQFAHYSRVRIIRRTVG